MNRIKSRAFLAAHAAEAWHRQYAAAIDGPRRHPDDAKRDDVYGALLVL